MKTLPDEISDLGKRKINTERIECVQELGDGFLREKNFDSWFFLELYCSFEEKTQRFIHIFSWNSVAHLPKRKM
jgi:hypothetical protein